MTCVFYDSPPPGSPAHHQQNPRHWKRSPWLKENPADPEAPVLLPHPPHRHPPHRALHRAQALHLLPHPRPLPHLLNLQIKPTARRDPRLGGGGLAVHVNPSTR
ncbi:unnamed protein product [Staurois parvus]|uniref:Uncharacterized protein n=1 Tax=Staurois parvus TaxID=386267 RepID=A0ABN9AQX4_9NEOB|nr:unnamed protein product [Staurois parvus]